MRPSVEITSDHGLLCGSRPLRPIREGKKEGENLLVMLDTGSRLVAIYKGRDWAMAHQIRDAVSEALQGSSR